LACSGRRFGGAARGAPLARLPRLLRRSPHGAGGSVVSVPLLPYEQQLRRPAERAKEIVKRVIAATARPLGTLIRVATEQPAIALTFDDGPDPDETPRVLDLLAAHGAHGTFFMV